MKITAILLLLVFAIPAIAYLLLQSSTIQTSVAERIMRDVSKNLNTKFTISKVDIAFLYRIRLNDVYLQDLAGDTMFYAKSLTIGIRSFNPLKNKIALGAINLDHPVIGLAIDSTHTVNIKYFINKLKGNGKGKGQWKVTFGNVRIRNGKFSLKNYYRNNPEFGVNYTNMQLYDLNADVQRFKPSKDSLSFRIRSLNFREASGFRLNDLKAEFSLYQHFLKFYNITFETPSSSVKGNEISFFFNQWSNFQTDSIFQKVKMRINISDSRVNLTDISYFAPTFRNTNQTIYFSGQVKGFLGNMKAKNIEFRFGNRSLVKGEFNLDGLPDFWQTFIHANIKELTTDAEDIAALNLPKQIKLKLPDQLKKLGLITYHGEFTGFPNDFVAFGNFNTQLGYLSTDLLFRPDTSNYVDFEGKFTARNFDLGTLLDASNNIGKISLSANVNGSERAGKSINADMKCVIQQLDFRNYQFKNINIAGNLNNKTYNGSININDPNIDLEFLGKVNLTDSVASYNFTINVTDANLYALNIEKSDPSFTASFYLIANANGNSLNSLNGEFKVLNSLFTKKNQQLQIYDFNIIAESNRSINHISLRSDILDADVSGTYELNKMSESLKKFIYDYLPSVVDSGAFVHNSLRNNFTLNAVIKDAQSVFDFFAPEYSLASKTTLECDYKPEGRGLSLFFISPKVKFKGITWNGVNMLVTNANGELNFEAGGKSLVVNNKLTLDNFNTLIGAKNDSLNVTARWNNWQELAYRGNINLQAVVSRIPGQNYLNIDANVLPTVIVANDTAWNIKPCKIAVDSNSITVDNMVIYHGNSFLKLNGSISHDPKDKMELDFYRFDLGNLNTITRNTGYSFGGILNGNASVQDLYKNPIFNSSLTIDSLMLNSEQLGRAGIQSSWDNIRKSISIDAHAMRDSLKTIDISGEYLPVDNKRLSFNINLDKLRLNIFNPYLKNIFSNLRGIASGKLKLSGTASQPLLNGELNLQKTAFTINYLKTRYSFSDVVSVENNNIYFRNIRIYDQGGNSAYLTGTIRNKYLKDFWFDMNINAENFMCLNTTHADNNMFFGTAYATGLIKISGPPKNLTMDVTATTSKNTNFNIPLSSQGQLTDYNFIKETVEDTTEGPEEPQPSYQVNLSGMQLNFNLEATPDAQVQIIFDPTVGDIIKGNGSGNFDMKISTSGNFLMYGDYTINEGSYLFTLKNLINRKFNIEPGGKIKWNGDPFDATIDIVADYRTKASLSELFATEDERYKTNTIVDCRLNMTGKLMTPNVKYEIYLPYAEEETRMSLKNAINTTDDLNKEFLSLLIQGHFVPVGSPGSPGSGTPMATQYADLPGANVSQFFSNQLSHWLSQINKDVDVNINYHSDQKLKSNDVEVALSTQLFNDKLSINGSVDMATNATANTSDKFVGEFDIDYKLTKNGKFRLKTYNHVNNDMLYENSPYTQGLGFYYKEEFNTLGELWRRYMKSLFGPKEKAAAPDPAKK